MVCRKLTYYLFGYALYPHPSNFTWIITACILLVISCIIPTIKRSKVSYSLFALFLIGGFATLYVSTMSYYLISTEQIVIKKYEHKDVYAWGNVEEVVYEYVVGDKGSYTFTMRDGTQFVIKENGQYTNDEKRKLYNTAVSYDVAFIEHEKTGESPNKRSPVLVVKVKHPSRRSNHLKTDGQIQVE